MRQEDARIVARLILVIQREGLTRHQFDGGLGELADT